MNHKEIVSFVNNFNIVAHDSNNYSKFYEVCNDVDTEVCEITREEIEDNKVDEKFLLSIINTLLLRHSANNEKKAICQIVHKDSEIYSEKNVLNKSFSKETLKEAISNVLKKGLKPKFLLVTTDLYADAHKIIDTLTDDLTDEQCAYCKSYTKLLTHKQLIVNSYIKSHSFAAIITDAERSFKSFMSKSKLSVVTRLTAQTCDIIIESRSDFVVGNPDGIYVISF
jgi:hypothetical protein